MLLMILKKSRKTAIFENCVINLSSEKNQMFVCFFKMARPVCIRLYFDLINIFTQKPFIFNNFVFFAFLTKKKRGSKRKLFQKHH